MMGVILFETGPILVLRCLQSVWEGVEDVMDMRLPRQWARPESPWLRSRECDD
jgi:hypothetical protein